MLIPINPRIGNNFNPTAREKNNPLSNLFVVIVAIRTIRKTKPSLLPLSINSKIGGEKYNAVKYQSDVKLLKTEDIFQNMIGYIISCRVPKKIYGSKINPKNVNSSSSISCLKSCKSFSIKGTLVFKA